MRRQCEDCGGIKPPPLSARTKKQLKLVKQRAEAAKRKASAARQQQAVGNFVKKLPVPVRTCLNKCGIGNISVRTEIVSYAKLRKSICQNHPVDPQTGDKFSIIDSVTVDNYYLKLSDACGCMKCYEFLSNFKNRIKNFISKKKEKQIEKPHSMKDVPDGDKVDSYEGLTKAAIFVGEGPILYLQIIKTLAIFCILLTVLNLPLIIIFSSSAGR